MARCVDCGMNLPDGMVRCSECTEAWSPAAGWNMGWKHLLVQSRVQELPHQDPLPSMPEGTPHDVPLCNLTEEPDTSS